MASAGFEHVNLGTKGQQATSRPPKPVIKGTYGQIQECAQWSWPTYFTVEVSRIKPKDKTCFS